MKNQDVARLQFALLDLLNGFAPNRRDSHPLSARHGWASSTLMRAAYWAGPAAFLLDCCETVLIMSYGGRGYGGGYGRRDSGFSGPKPVESGKEYEVQIAELSRQGDGIARIQGFVIFVKGARVGEKTKIRITNVGPRFATAEKVTGEQPETQKAEPKQVAPAVSEEEKPELQDYKSKEGENPPAG